MILRFARTAAVLVTLAAAASAQLTLDSIVPAEGTVGTAIEVALSGDLGKGKPKLWLTRADDAATKPKPTKLKVGDVGALGPGQNGLAVSFAKTKTGPGLYDLHVRLKGQDEQVFEDVFSVRAPTVDSVTPDTAAAKDEVTVRGMHFGLVGKPKVSLIPQAGGKIKKAKVGKGATDDTLTIKLPKVDAGTYDLLVATKVGEGLLEGALVIQGPAGGGGGDFLKATLSNDTMAMLTSNLEFPQGFGSSLFAFDQSTAGAPATVITGSMTVGGLGGENFGMSFSIPFDPVNTPTPYTIEMPTDPTGFFNIAASQDPVTGGQDGPSWHAGFGDTTASTLTVTGADAQGMQGTFHFVLLPDDDNPGAGVVTLSDGSFSVTFD